MNKAVICAMLASASLAIKSSAMSFATATTAVKEHCVPAPELVGEDATLMEMVAKLIDCQGLTKEMVRAELNECLTQKYEEELLLWSATWDGYFMQYGKEQDMVFQELFIGDSETVIGKGHDLIGSFELHGTREGSHVEFEKYYPQVNPDWAHFDPWYNVYSGELSDEDTVVSGRFELWWVDKVTSDPV